MKFQRHFLGIRVDDVTTAEVLTEVHEAIEAQRKLRIVTVNPELVMIAQTKPAFKESIESADIVTADGVGLQLVGSITNRPLRKLVKGADLCEHVAEAAADNGWRLFLLGAPPGVAEQAAANLQATYPKLTICGTYAGGPSDDQASAIIGRIKASEANIVLVAFGSPAQELWLTTHLAATGASVGVGVGGSFDFIAGTAKRAPRWMRRIGLEWLFRLVQEPWRWRRMLALPRFALGALFEKRK